VTDATLARANQPEKQAKQTGFGDERMNRREAVGLVAVAWTNGRA
jgi:hypothetical protein